MKHKNNAKFYLFEIIVKLNCKWVKDTKKNDTENTVLKKNFLNKALLDNQEKYKEISIINHFGKTDNNSVNLEMKYSDKYFKLDNLKYESVNNNYQYYCLLNHANKKILSNDLRDFKDGTTRDIKQTDDEGASVSSHLAFKIVTDKYAEQDRLFCAMEAQTGITPTSFITYLNKIFYKNEDFKTNINDSSRKLQVYPVVNYIACKSEILKDILIRGNLKTIKLSTRMANSNQDSDPFLCEHSKEMTLKVAKKINLTSDDCLKGIKNLSVKYKDFDTMKVTIVTDGITNTNEFNNNSDILEQAFIHQENIMFDEINILKTRYDDISIPIIEKMFSEILTNEKLNISN